jgi:hypothetical protein
MSASRDVQASSSAGAAVTATVMVAESSVFPVAVVATAVSVLGVACLACVVMAVLCMLRKSKAHRPVGTDISAETKRAHRDQCEWRVENPC